MHLTKRTDTVERVVLAGVMLGGQRQALFDQDMDEMAQLCRTAGVEVAATVVQRRDAPVASTYIGGGKVEEIRDIMRERECRALIIDCQLSPGQVRNIEEVVQAKVLDRSQLILDIFAKHASTTESQIQVELAQMRTLYPRLTHAWSHFSRQYAGVGTKGPGEKQLEVDRRLVQKRITDLSRRLKDVEKGRVTQRKGRSDAVRATIVGYTNVGKSSLLNRLTHADVLVEDKLFATLDTTTRRLFLPGFGPIVLSDTVGFLRKLPHHLVASFKSTLQAALETDLLVPVLDASSAWIESQRDTVEQVLAELGAGNLPRVTVLNKADLLRDPVARKGLEVAYPDAVFVSARTGEGLEQLKTRLAQALAERGAGQALSDAVARKVESYQPKPPGPPPLPADYHRV